MTRAPELVRLQSEYRDQTDANVSKMKSFRTAIRDADDYMAAGDKNAAKAVLQNLFEIYSDKKTLYGQAINIYLGGKMFDEARGVFSLYKSKFGCDLRHTDFSLAEIIREQNEYESAANTYDKADVKCFRRMSFWERGRFSGLPMIFPVKEITIFPGALVFKKAGHEYRFGWSEIQDAFITSRRGYKGYAFSEPYVKTLFIKPRDQTFKIDVSDNYPDFKHNDILLEQLRKHLALREDKKGKHGN